MKNETRYRDSVLQFCGQPRYQLGHGDNIFVSLITIIEHTDHQYSLCVVVFKWVCFFTLQKLLIDEHR